MQRLLSTADLMHRPRGAHAGIEFDLAKRALVSSDILLQKAQQRFGLLRTQVDALKVPDLHVTLGLLLQGTENQKEVPDVYSHLHAVRIVFTIGGIIRQLYVGLHRIVHGTKCKRDASYSTSEVAGTEGAAATATHCDKNCYPDDALRLVERGRPPSGQRPSE